MARPLKFDRAELLASATSLFWSKGYRGVSISDLVSETGVLPGSLYSTFGNKDGVFVACVHRYAEMVEHIYLNAEKETSAVAKIERLFEEMVLDATSGSDHRGCFVVNSLLEIAPEKPELAEVLQKYVKISEQWMVARIQEGIANGEILSDVVPEDLAADLFGIVYALRVKERSGESVARLRSFKDSVLPAILSPVMV